MPGKQSKIPKVFYVLLIVALFVVGLDIYLTPAIRNRVEWQVEIASAYLRGVFNPIQAMPTAIAAADATQPVEVLPPTPEATATLTLPVATGTPASTATLAASPTPEYTATPEPTATPIPGKVILASPPYEKQDPNSCGPAALTMLLRTLGWAGDQKTISAIIKPNDDDRNVNIEELMAYILTQAGWLEPQFRVGGDINRLKELVAAGFPVLIEEGMKLDQNYWPGDDLWAGHYLLINGYDDETQTFVVQDSFYGADRRVTYEEVDRNWKAFNRVYMIVYLPEQRPQIQQLLGSDWDRDQNRKNALDAAQKEIDTDSTDSYAWFNLGSNLVYFEKYQDAGKAYDTARQLGLPQRMLRYQFGPFFSYFNTSRNEELVALADYALKVTPNSEEAMLWKGWALYHLGKKDDALKMFQDALGVHPGYTDAQYAIDFVQNH